MILFKEDYTLIIWHSMNDYDMKVNKVQLSYSQTRAVLYDVNNLDKVHFLNKQMKLHCNTYVHNV